MNWIAFLCGWNFILTLYCVRLHNRVNMAGYHSEKITECILKIAEILKIEKNELDEKNDR